jgi:hypothetical protein
VFAQTVVVVVTFFATFLELLKARGAVIRAFAQGFRHRVR